jgi:hypothetical protein
MKYVVWFTLLALVTPPEAAQELVTLKGPHRRHQFRCFQAERQDLGFRRRRQNHPAIDC